MNYTEEQQQIINSDLNNIIVNAGPGSGKTHLLLGLAKRRSGNNMLLCFNRMIKDEILEKIEKQNIENLEPYTFHGLAYRYHLSTGRIKNFKHRNMSESLDFFTMNEILKDLGYTSIEPKFIHEMVNDIKEFCRSDCSFKDFFKDNDNINDIKKVWLHMKNDSNCKMFHEVYIKMFEMNLRMKKYGTPIVVRSSIFVDEFQDVSPCYASIIQNLICLKKVMVGDTLQKIYGFNGALGMNHHDFRLSKSFRIGKDSSDLCNKIIDILNIDDEYKLNGINKIQKIGNIPANLKKTILFRTNGAMIGRLIKETQEHNICAVSVNLYEEIRELIRLLQISESNPVFYKGEWLHNVEQIKYWSELSKDKMLIKCIKMIKSYGQDGAFNLLNQVLNNITTNENESNIILTTTHKTKGLEFENVELADDFVSIEKLKQMKEDGKKEYLDEFYILYVAITRAYGILQLNKDLKKYGW